VREKAFDHQQGESIPATLIKIMPTTRVPEFLVRQPRESRVLAIIVRLPLRRGTNLSQIILAGVVIPVRSA
jgi:hypothetical protein